MKKFFSMVVMALVMVFMVSCGAGSSSAYKKGDPQPKIDAEAGTVNGKKYDNKTEACWQFNIKATVKVLGVKSSVDEVDYYWGTEFEVVATMEQTMWAAAQAGTWATASYTYSKTTDTYEQCTQREGYSKNN